MKNQAKVDVDIALDNVSGLQFANFMSKWSNNTQQKPIKFGVIRSNPEKSKHLETATAQLGKFSVDFVNLRTETYADASRIPTIEIGTPEQDALRRDLTINSLYYNINTGKIEDFTKMGIKDLADGIVRTPLPPLTTLIGYKLNF